MGRWGSRRMWWPTPVRSVSSWVRSRAVHPAAAGADSAPAQRWAPKRLGPPRAVGFGSPRQHQGRSRGPEAAPATAGGGWCGRCAARSAVLAPRRGCLGGVGGRNPFLNAARGRRDTTTWWGAIPLLSCDDPGGVVHRDQVVGVGGGGVQGVAGGPPPRRVPPLPGGDALGVAAAATGLDFGGQPRQAQELAGSLHGALTPARGDHHPGDGGSAAPPGAVIGVGGLSGRHRQHRGQGHTTAAGGHQAGPHDEVAAPVHPGDVGQPTVS